MSSRASGKKRPRDAIQGSTPVEKCAADTDMDEQLGSKKVRWEARTSDPELHCASESDRVCLATYCQQGRIGCAYYDSINCRLYVMEDSQDSVHYDLMHVVLDQANPDVVLTSARSDDSFIDAMRDYTTTAGSTFQIRPHKDFQPAKGKERILSLPLLSILPPLGDVGCGPSSKLHPGLDNVDEVSGRSCSYEADPTTRRWNAAIRLGNFASSDSAPFCMSSIGALLDHLTRERAVYSLGSDEVDTVEIREIEALSLDGFMQINADALFSLQIFEDEGHASIHSDRTKEGLSLFGTLNFTKTALGRTLLRSWLLRPSISIPVIKARHDAVECFLNPQNLVSSGIIHGHLRGIRNVPRLLANMKSGKGKLPDWQGLVKFIFHSVMLRDAINDIHVGISVEIIQKFSSAIDISHFREVGTLINDTIDWEESALAGRVCVRPHIDEELDQRKHIYHGIDNVLSTVAEQVSHLVPVEYASSINVVYFPQLGFLICTPMLEEWKSEAGIAALDGWTYQFSTDSYVYFKSKEMEDMDRHIGDLHSLIVDREIEIIEALLERVLFFEDAISHACDVCAELDCLLSFAEAARAYGYNRPDMVEENIIYLKQARHPLQEQAVNTFVPNDARVGGAGERRSIADGYEDDQSGNRIVVCTGANASGKSVYLKQVALVQIMAQAGSYVPAERATLGIVDKVFTRIQTRESVSKVQSAFMIDLNQVSLALRNATARSLILLDEFGKGTASTDGAGILCGVLKELLRRGAECPKVLVATHFRDLFRDGLLDPQSIPISFLQMEVLIVADGEQLIKDNERRERITYLYRLVDGTSLVSHAAKCARIFGLSPRLAERAERISHLASMHELGKIADEQMMASEVKELQECEAVCRRFLAWISNDDHSVSVKVQLETVLGKG